MDLNFAEFLEEYVPIMPESVQDGVLKRMTYSENLTKISFYIAFSHLVPAQDLIALEHELEIRLEIHAVRLHPRYTPELFTMTYFPDLVMFLKREMTVVNGFIDGAEVTLDGDNLHIQLHNGGYDILQKYHVADFFSGLLEQLFSKPFHVEFLGDASVSDDQFQAMIAQAEKELPKHSEQFQAQPSAPAPSAGGEKAPKPTAQSVAMNEDIPGVVPGSAVLIKGRPIRDIPMPIREAVEVQNQRVVVMGDVFAMDSREVRGERTILTYQITDGTYSVLVKIFDTTEKLSKMPFGEIKKGSTLLIIGRIGYDDFAREDVLKPESIVMVKRQRKMDNAPKKRVELHCHTNMSQMDAVTPCERLVQRAHEWGHPAIAITDHGIAQAFPDAMNAWRGFKDKDFKVIFGCEAYVVNDLNRLMIIDNPGDRTLQDEIIIFDVETTGLSPTHDRLTEIGAVRMRGMQVVETFNTMVDPEQPIPAKIVELTGITDAMVEGAPKEAEALRKFMEFCGENPVLAAHNAKFDTSFVRNVCKRQHITFDFATLDTLILCKCMLPTMSRHRLDGVAKALKLGKFDHHRASDDAQMLAKIYKELVSRLIQTKGAVLLSDLNNKTQEIDVKKLKSFHQIILVRNHIGLKNLYKLISYGHIECFYRKPLIPKSVLMQHREGLIFGSACEAGELFQAFVDERPHEEIVQLAKFYDYLEIQPAGNNAFMIRNGTAANIEELQEYNRKIVALGDELGIPVCATCDVHFLDPEDEVYRRIIMAGKGFDDADDQAPLFLRTTEEMLAEFSYLGADTAHQVVIENTNKIADMIEPLSPVHPDKAPPVIPNSDQMLRTICENRALELYGNPLPEIVKERLDRELNSIISNGYSVMYIIAQKLVWKSNDDGYLVGSRGSVGSSFAATMAGITEVNPLSPHYLCPKCYYNEFDSEDVKKFAGGAGCDMPDKICPRCGHKLNKMGFDIPFETFLGFKGNKEPDIDLNFSNEYQSKAHSFTEVIFGKGQTFKAGTIGTVAEKTAYGYVFNYFKDKSEKEGRPIVKRRCEIERIAEGCVDIRRTTGQHPGGIVVLPIGDEIHSFTPVQHPANDCTTSIVTTHFDYHSIDHNLLKLDILGHLDPTMIRMLQDLTGIDPLEIPLDSKEVMSLFKDTSALGITPADIGGCKLGALGIPEFGTDFAMQMLIDTKPQYFSDLVRIAGLSHGTDVWLGNAQVLLKEGKATISTAICTRDDIMIYLIQKGIESETAFTIMEKVRKGKGLTEEQETIMREHDVPDWYIWSCKKIKYMFPKAHAAAYVMMAWRVAYCKVFYPLAYYCAYFSIRANAFDYEKMAMGRDKLEYFIDDYKNKKSLGTITNTEEDELKDMRIVQEMYARGYDFMPIDIYKAKARSFQIIDGKIMPSFKVIDKVGEVAGEGIEIAARAGEFLSKDDLRARAKVGQTVIDKLNDLGLLGSMADSNQLSLFDF